ncbi:MAG: EF-Tu/IF-2/RF-3 family GTPase [Nitrospirota bacterium]
MTRKVKAKKKQTKKTAVRTGAKKPPRKPVKKKALKKTTKKKPAKKAAKKVTRKKTVTRPAEKKTAAPKSIAVKSALAAATHQPAEPGSQEEAVGTVTHYYSHLQVAVIQLNKGMIRVGDTIHIKGTTSDSTQIVESMEYEHQPLTEAVAGQSVGLRVKDIVREHDIVYIVK